MKSVQVIGLSGSLSLIIPPIFVNHLVIKVNVGLSYAHTNRYVGDKYLSDQG
jgi:hypothetical protein